MGREQTASVTVVDGYVPVIDLSGRNEPDRRASLAGAIGTACAQSGFFTVVGHDVPADLVARMYSVTNGFFTLPDEQKQRVANRPGISGFRRTGGATAHSIDQQSPPDLCEAFSVHVTGDLSERERRELGNQWATWTLANVWPEQPVEFRQVWQDYLSVMTELAADLLRLFALALGLAEDFFDDKFDRHGSSLTANYYYPQVRPPLPGQLRRGPHTDFGGLTVLYQEDGQGGLQVLHGSQWRDVPAIPGSFVVNIGDLMALWTGGRWVSTMHRVVNPEQGNTSSRLSIPFFYLPNHDASIEPMRPFTGSIAGIENGPVSAGQWMSHKIEKLFTVS